NKKKIKEKKKKIMITYPMKQIEYVIDYVKDKLIDEDGVSKVIDEENCQTLLIEGASFLLGMNQEELQKMLINENLLYWAASRNVKSIEVENSIQSEFNKGWLSSAFQKLEYFCYSKYNTTFEQVYEKGLKELQVQLTIYWDYITAMNICDNLLDDWSSNVVDRLIYSKEKYYEMSLVVGHKGHCFYLSLCKASNYVLVRIDNRLMDTVPSNTLHPKNEDGWIQPYLVAYFPYNGVNINKNKKWLENYIKNAFEWRYGKDDESMKHLYCNTPPCEGELPSIVNNWPYRPVQTDAENCYMRGHNVGWFRNQEGTSFVFHRSHHSIGMNKQKKDQEKEKVKSLKQKMEHQMTGKKKFDLLIVSFIHLG
ncbi:hypothetical protein RFI_00890, partial [Reticulomyxa filosa]